MRIFYFDIQNSYLDILQLIATQDTALAQVGRLSEAKDLYERSLVGNPNLGNAHLNLGNIAFRTGDITGAVESYQR